MKREEQDILEDLEHPANSRTVVGFALSLPSGLFESADYPDTPTFGKIFKAVFRQPSPGLDFEKGCFFFLLLLYLVTTVYANGECAQCSPPCCDGGFRVSGEVSFKQD